MKLGTTKLGAMTTVVLIGLFTGVATGMAQAAVPASTTASESISTKRINELQAEVDQAEAKVSEIAAALRVKGVLSSELLPEDLEQQKRQQLQQLKQAIKAALDAKLQLQHAQLDDAETRIAASRKLLAERKVQQADIAAQRLKALLSIPPEHASPQAVLDAWERCMIAKDYERFVALLSDDEANRMAGMLIQSMQSMSLMIQLIQNSDADMSDDQTQQIKVILAEVHRYMRANPPPPAVAAMERLTNILPSVFYQMGATSNGKPLQPPNLTATEYAALLRQASGILTDSRAFCVAMLKAASAMQKEDHSQPIPSQWKIEIEGSRAIATQTAEPLEQTVTKTRQVTLVVEDGRWMISQLGSDEELMQAVSGSIESVHREVTPSAELNLSSPSPTSSSVYPPSAPYPTTSEAPDGVN